MSSTPHSTSVGNSSPSHISNPPHESSEPFPNLSESQLPGTSNQEAQQKDTQRGRASSSTSTVQNRLRSVSKTFQESNPPTGFMIATSQVASSIPSLVDIRRGSYGSQGWSGEGQLGEKERRASSTGRQSLQNSDDLSRQRIFNTSSPLVQPSSQHFRHQSVPEAPEEESRTLGLIASGIPLGQAENSITQTESSSYMADIKDKKRPLNRGIHDEAEIIPIVTHKGDVRYRTDPFDNGYQFPPKQRWTKSTSIGLLAFWKFFITPVGFLVVIYGLNIVAWGGMLFLLLCNASPAMCTPTCNDIDSPRRVWIEIDSQILNALFCVTGFGLIPWRFRDLYYLMQYRLQKKEVALRRLAGINRSWFRLEGSQDLPAEIGPENIDNELQNVPENLVPFPVSKIADAPLTGNRAPPTALWKLDYVIWTMVWNTFFQALLSGFMWGMNRIERPPWSTGLFVALAMIVAAMGGIMSFVEGKHVKAIEGVPVTDKEREILQRDRELGVTHYNNIKDEKPKEKKQKQKGGLFHRKHKVEDVELNENAASNGSAHAGG